MQFITFMRKIEEVSKTLIWWKPEQKERGEHLLATSTKGERPWIIPESTGLFIHDLITEKRFNRVLELGTSIGYSTLWIAHALAQTGGTVTTIERSFNKIPVAAKFFKKSGLEKHIVQKSGEIIDVVNNFPASQIFDFIFMDADRGHYHEYLPLLEKHLVPHTIIVADNANNMNRRMQPFLNLLTKKGWNWSILDLDNGLLIASKINDLVEYYNIQ